MSKSSKEITIGEILRTLEGESLLIDISDDNSNDMERFVNKVIWNEINKKINEDVYKRQVFLYLLKISEIFGLTSYP